MKVAFIFTTSRDEIVRRMHHGEDADTALRGSNHIDGSDNFTIPPKSIKAFFFFPRILHYNFLIAQDNLLLGYMVSLFARIFGIKTRWLYIAINSSTLIKSNVSRPLRLFLLKKIWSSYARIICLSREQLEDFVKIGIPRNHLTFIPFGVDEHFFKPTEIIEEDCVVSVGRDAGRDYETLFEAVKFVDQQFIIVASPRNISLSTVIPKNISVLYDKSLLEIRDLYRRAKLIVIVSKDTQVPEGSDCSGQTVVLDALAAGKAVITTHRPWIADYFVSNEDLIVVDPNNPKVLSDAINNLLNDAKKRERLAKSGHDKVVAHYTTRAFAKALSDLMNSFIQ